MRTGRLNSVRIVRGRPSGSALILTVVLTSLLAILAVLFIMTARLDKMASSAASDNEQLGLAVETVVSQVNEVLVNDAPGMPTSRAYYDYPDVNKPWLADLEPNQPGGSWRQITNLRGTADPNFRNAAIKIIGEHDSVKNVTLPQTTTADADGDGVGDARWYPLKGVVSSKGRPIYAAVRIIDNGGMLNLNTAWTQLPNARIDGTSQSQIEVANVLGASPVLLQKARTNQTDTGTPAGLEAVIWQYPPAYGSPYTPFDVSDELSLRYRFYLYHNGYNSRAETWANLNLGTMPSTPVGKGDSNEPAMWYHRVAAAGPNDPNFAKDFSYYAYRHVLTTYNMDRIIPPKPIVLDSGGTLNKRVNVNIANMDQIHAAVRMALLDRNPADPAVEALANQITANLLDYIDDDNEVTVVAGPGSTSGAKYYGFERPCVYLSELAYNFKRDAATGAVSQSSAIELCKPYFEDGDPCSTRWRIEVRYAGVTATEPILWSGNRRFHVLRLQDPLAPLPVQFQDPREAAAAAQIGFVRNGSPKDQLLTVSLQDATMVSLQRLVQGDWITVDFKALPSGFASSAADANDPSTQSGKLRCLQRDISDNKCVLHLWSEPNVAVPNLGSATANYVSPTTTVIQAFPANRPLINIGELGMVFAKSAYGVSSSDTPGSVLIDLHDRRFADLFNYLTVMDPSRHGASADETRIMGRININTAPWPVLAQLPWIQYPSRNNTNPGRAQAIVSRRDSLGAYKSIGDLMQVERLLDLGSDKLDDLYTDNPPGPDLTSDTARDDTEERDILFTRLSDLVTVRSDVFTAYILVRIGDTGPQKRVIAILDRSMVSPSNPKVRVVALYAVADPR